MKKIVVIDGTVTVSRDSYTVGEEIPSGLLSRKQIADLEGVGCIEQIGFEKEKTTKEKAKSEDK